ncbi:MAG: hypothetical protein ABSE40_09915 [Candidatus Sulfotelmatobacter sp.]|jgi:hypothetical protein
MKYKMLALILALTVASWAQTATQNTPAAPPQSTAPAEKGKCPCCDKMTGAKEGQSCCHHEMAGKDEKTMSCCAGKDEKSCCGGTDAKSCKKSDKDKGACCADYGKDKTAAGCCGGQCGKDHEKGCCCSAHKTEKTA